MRWEDVDFGKRRLVIQAAASKSTEPEVVDGLPETVWIWLAKYRLKEGRIAPGKHAEQYQEVKAACGLKSWPNDVARHTFASNLYGLTGSIEEVGRALLHHATRITLKHYVAKGISKESAWAYFGMRP